jgi:hypothetical protein
MPTAVVVLIVVAAAAALFWLAWWSSGRSRGLGRSRATGDGTQDYAGVRTATRQSSMGTDISGGGGSI